MARGVATLNLRGAALHCFLLLLLFLASYQQFNRQSLSVPPSLFNPVAFKTTTAGLGTRMLIQEVSVGVFCEKKCILEAVFNPTYAVTHI